jgi:methylmalonyl-CoA/ethylmalonyl-CoA epimerase
MDMKSLSDQFERGALKKVDHIGIAVKSIDDALNKWEALFGVRAQHIETVEEHFVRVAFVPVGEVLIEFLEPTEPGAGVIGEFLEKHGEGFNHIALRVDDLERSLSKIREEGGNLSKPFHKDDRPRKGSRDSLIAFIDQKDTNDVLIELVQMRDGHEFQPE